MMEVQERQIYEDRLHCDNYTDKQHQVALTRAIADIALTARDIRYVLNSMLDELEIFNNTRNDQ